MSYYLNAYLKLLEVEGDYSNITFDYGKATKYGISLRFLQRLPLADADITRDGHVDEADIKALERKHAFDFYDRYFWRHYRLDEICNQAIADKALLLFVNMRGQMAATIIQRACRAAGHRVAEDGVLGSKSFAAINAACHRALGAAISSEAAGYYRLRCVEDASQSIFLEGWLNRAYL